MQNSARDLPCFFFGALGHRTAKTVLPASGDLRCFGEPDSGEYSPVLRKQSAKDAHHESKQFENRGNWSAVNCLATKD
jgi:hypothetical protein